MSVTSDLNKQLRTMRGHRKTLMGLMRKDGKFWNMRVPRGYLRPSLKGSPTESVKTWVPKFGDVPRLMSFADCVVLKASYEMIGLQFGLDLPKLDIVESSISYQPIEEYPCVEAAYRHRILYGLFGNAVADEIGGVHLDKEKHQYFIGYYTPSLSTKKLRDHCPNATKCGKYWLLDNADTMKVRLLSSGKAKPIALDEYYLLLEAALLDK